MSTPVAPGADAASSSIRLDARSLCAGFAQIPGAGQGARPAARAGRAPPPALAREPVRPAGSMSYPPAPARGVRLRRRGTPRHDPAGASAGGNYAHRTTVLEALRGRRPRDDRDARRGVPAQRRGRVPPSGFCCKTPTPPALREGWGRSGPTPPTPATGRSMATRAHESTAPSRARRRPAPATTRRCRVRRHPAGRRSSCRSCADHPREGLGDHDQGKAGIGDASGAESPQRGTTSSPSASPLTTGTWRHCRWWRSVVRAHHDGQRVPAHRRQAGFARAAALRPGVLAVERDPVIDRWGARRVADALRLRRRQVARRRHPLLDRGSAHRLSAVRRCSSLAALVGAVAQLEHRPPTPGARARQGPGIAHQARLRPARRHEPVARHGGRAAGGRRPWPMVGASVVLLLDAASFVVAAIAAFWTLVPRSAEPPASRPTLRTAGRLMSAYAEELRDGFRFLRGDRLLVRGSAWMVLLTNMFDQARTARCSCRCGSSQGSATRWGSGPSAARSASARSSARRCSRGWDHGLPLRGSATPGGSSSAGRRASSLAAAVTLPPVLAGVVPRRPRCRLRITRRSPRRSTGASPATCRRP